MNAERDELQNEPRTSDETIAEYEGDEMATDDQAPLLREGDLRDYRRRWERLQVRFVDDPRDSVQQADALVLDLTKRLTSSFSDERTALERRWDGGDDVSTEDLRTVLQRYRSFFDRLLSA